jgi:MFS family permease
MTPTVALPDPDRRARRNVRVLVAAQAILGAQMSANFIIGGLAGRMLAPTPCLATLPITLIVIGSMLTATPLSALMQRFGRRPGFFLGAVGGMAGAAVSALGLHQGSFGLFLLGAALTGIYMSAQNFYRFAAADTASDAYRPKAISAVMAGGLLSALVGPQMVNLTEQSTVVPFLGTYLAIIALNAVGMLLFLFLDIPRPPPRSTAAVPMRSRRDMLRDPRIAVAVICGTVSYALMNLVMTSSPLAVVGCGFQVRDASNVVSAHVIAMYLPSVFTGYVIAAIGVERVVGLGLAILTCAGAVALSGVSLPHFYGALVLLGIGWNFGFIGATAMLAGSHRPEERGRVQGMNDLLVFFGVTIASLSSGGLLNCAGGSVVEGWNMVNLAMLPFLVLAGGSLVWLVLRPTPMRP